MKKILLFLSFLLISIGVFSETLVYTLDGTITDGTNGYDTESDITQNSKNWSVKGNTTMNPWRIGGKSITNIDRVIYSKTAISENISKMVITHGAASNINVNSMTVIVSTAQNGKGTITSTLTPAFVANGDITINRPDGKDWSGKYYKIIYNVTVSGSSNKFVEFMQAKFYAENTPTPSYTITAASNDTTYGTVSLSGNIITGSPKLCYQYASPAYTVTSGSASVSKSDNAFTVTPSSNCTVQINFEAKPKYTISFNNAAGTNPESITQSACDENITLPDTAQLSVVCSEMGWRFGGWTTKSSGEITSSDLVGNSFTPTKDTTLYAVFKKSEGRSGESTYVTFNSSSSDSNQSKETDSEIKEIIVDDYNNISTFSGYKLYVGVNGAKLSSSKDIGYITINLSSPITTNQITVEASQYGSDGGDLHVEVNSDTNFGLDIAPSTGTCVFTNATNVEISSVTITTTSGRAYLQSVTIGEDGFTDYSFNPICQIIHVDTVTLLVDTIRIHIGETYKLIPSIIPTNASNKSIEWYTLNSSVAIVADSIVTGIEKGETYIAVKTEDEDKIAYCVVIVLGNPDINIVEWNPNYIKIDIDNFDGAVTAVVENKNTQELHTENIATELFFSKYFEAAGQNKMLAIYNGTKDTLDLSKYYISKGDESPKKFDLSNFGKLTGYILPNEEIIFARFDNTNSAKSCADTINGFENWVAYTVGEAAPSYFGSTFDFGGRASLGLYKKGVSIDTLIDVIGSHNNGTLMRIGKQGTSICPYAKINEYNDDAGFYTYTGDSVHGTSDNYFLSTNRCLLIRKNTVHSGDSAVKYNIYNTFDDCSTEIAQSFVTLSSEWMGFRIGTGNSSSDEINALTCMGLSELGKYDYGNYYAQYSEIKTIDLLGDGILQTDGTYQIPIEHLDTLSCTLLKVIVSDGSEEKEEEYQIPIFVNTHVNSNNVLFTQEGEDCPTCDVVIINGGELTINPNLQNRNITVYPGGRLIVPAGKEYTLKSLTLRRDNNDLPYLLNNGTITLESDSNYFVEIRSDAIDWRWMTLPAPHKVANIKDHNGKKAKLGTEVLVSHYDGQTRAINKKNGWATTPADSILDKGQGFLFGLNLEGNKKKTYKFTFPNAAVNMESSSKTIPGLRAWGCNNENLAPNHKGWNLIGNPFTDNDTTNIITPIKVGELVKDSTGSSWNGQWVYKAGSEAKNVRYAVIPVIGRACTADEAAAGGYASELLDDYVLPPFTSFFVQIGGNEDVSQSLTINPIGINPINKIVAKNYQKDEDEELFLRIKIGDKKTGCFISNHFNENYEPGDDLESRYTYYQLINGYKLLYSAINDSIIENGIQIHSLGGKVTLDPKVEIEKFEQIYILYNNEWHDLLHGDEPEVSGDFILYGKRKVQEDIPTDIGDIKPGQGTYKFINSDNVYINNKGKIYNIFGSQIK